MAQQQIYPQTILQSVLTSDSHKEINLKDILGYNEYDKLVSSKSTYSSTIASAGYHVDDVTYKLSEVTKQTEESDKIKNILLEYGTLIFDRSSSGSYGSKQGLSIKVDFGTYGIPTFTKDNTAFSIQENSPSITSIDFGGTTDTNVTQENDNSNSTVKYFNFPLSSATTKLTYLDPIRKCSVSYSIQTKEDLHDETWEKGFYFDNVRIADAHTQKFTRGEQYTKEDVTGDATTIWNTVNFIPYANIFLMHSPSDSINFSNVNRINSTMGIKVKTEGVVAFTDDVITNESNLANVSLLRADEYSNSSFPKITLLTNINSSFITNYNDAGSTGRYFYLAVPSNFLDDISVQLVENGEVGSNLDLDQIDTIPLYGNTVNYSLNYNIYRIKAPTGPIGLSTKKGENTQIQISYKYTINK